MTVGPLVGAIASMVFRPSPVLKITVSASGSSRPSRSSLLQRRDGDAAGGLGEDALGPGQQPDALDDLVVGDVLDGPTGAAGDVERVRPVGGVADGERLGDACPAAPGDDVAAGRERRRDREQPAAWAPNTLYGVPSTRPSRRAPPNALSTLVSSEPDAIGTTTCSGSRQPSCSATS